MPFHKNLHQRVERWGEAPFIVAPDSAPSIPNSVWGNGTPDEIAESARRAFENQSLGSIALSESSRKLLQGHGSALLRLLDN